MLSVENLKVEYPGGIVAVSDASLRCAQGEIVMVLGPNGAGKTTLLRGISGFTRSEGVQLSARSLMLDGASVLGRSPDEIVRRGLVLVPERDKIFTTLTAAENLKISDRQALSSALGRAVLDLFPQLERRLSAKAGLLSGGERQMLAIARALLLQPNYLLIDEISLGLAPGVVQSLYAAIRTIVEQSSIGVILVDESITHAASLADRVYVMRQTVLGPGADPAMLSSTDAFNLIYG